MKNPLTSKERRGLMAVAAAALLCIGAGFVFRSCGEREVVEVPRPPKGGEEDSVLRHAERPRSEGREEGKRKKKASSSGPKKKKSEKSYPTRSPLDEPIHN